MLTVCFLVLTFGSISELLLTSQLRLTVCFLVSTLRSISELSLKGLLYVRIKRLGQDVLARWNLRNVHHGSNSMRSISNAQLDTIVYIYRAPNLELWGIPYELREGQSPTDLWNSQYPKVKLAGQEIPRLPGPRKDWIPLSLGQDYTPNTYQRVCAWLDRQVFLPGNPREYVRVEG